MAFCVILFVEKQVEPLIVVEYSSRYKIGQKSFLKGIQAPANNPKASGLDMSLLAEPNHQIRSIVGRCVPRKVGMSNICCSCEVASNSLLISRAGSGNTKSR